MIHPSHKEFRGKQRPSQACPSAWVQSPHAYPWLRHSMNVLSYVLNTIVPPTRPHGPRGCISFMHCSQGSLDPLTSLVSFPNSFPLLHSTPDTLTFMLFPSTPRKHMLRGLYTCYSLCLDHSSPRCLPSFLPHVPFWVRPSSTTFKITSPVPQHFFSSACHVFLHNTHH